MTGFLAQEVEQAAMASNYDFSGVQKPEDPNGLYSLRYAEFVVPLVKAVQELSAQNENLKILVDQQQSMLEALSKDVERLRAE